MQYSFFFVATTGRTSTKIYGNHQFQKEILISSPCWGHNLHPWFDICMHINRLSVQFLYIYCHKFNEIFKKQSIPRGDAHIVALFGSDPSTQLYAVTMKNNRFYHFSANTGWHSRMIIGTINTKRICLVWVRPFNKELWPLMGYAVCI
jgi:hypothetical protein